jgi:glycosyltransferase involved in cell wall biosynthesis
MISTPFIAVPPPRYGGTELVVWELVQGLRGLGHEVRLFTVGEPGALYREPVWPPDAYHEANHAAWSIGELLAGEVPPDVIHSHVAAALPLARFAPAPLVYTIHHERMDSLTSFYAMQRGVRLVAVSDRQRALLPELHGLERVHHGLDPARYPLGPGGGPALFLGRLSREKGPHVAIDVARRAGAPLDLAGEAHWRDSDYYDGEVAPRLGVGVRLLGEVTYEQKLPLLQRARALLFPIAWEEPFGLVMIEAMFTGTPVVALARGSVPELIDEGVTGWVCPDEGMMVARLKALDGFDRERCRRRAIERFGRHRMVNEYLELYARVAGERAGFELTAQRS